MNRRERKAQEAQNRRAGGVPTPMPGSALAKRLSAGVELRNEGRLPEALVQLENALSLDPNHPRTLCELAHLQRMMDEPFQALKGLRRALQAVPGNAQVLANLAATLRDVGEFDEALRAFERAIEIQPDFPVAHNELGTTLQKLGRPREAIDAYRQSLAIEANQPNTLSNIGFTSLEAGDPEGALGASEACLKLDPRFAPAVVVQAYALNELGRSEEAQALMDLDQLVALIPIEKFEGHESVKDFNAALVSSIKGHPSLKRHPNQFTTRLGKQTGELGREEDGPLVVLKNEMDAAVKRYLEELPREQGHPYLKYRPRTWQLNMWATILGDGGHQLPHIHTSAWVSGVYYAHLPQAVKDSSEQEGWIEFGRAPESFQLQNPLPVQMVQPQEGTLVLFPSYVYHRTIPFEGETERVSVAVDTIALT